MNINLAAILTASIRKLAGRASFSPSFTSFLLRHPSAAQAHLEDRLKARLNARDVQGR